MKIYIALEHPDMTYYGDAEIHAVETSPEAVKAKLIEAGLASEGLFTNITIEEWEVTSDVGP